MTLSSITGLLALDITVPGSPTAKGRPRFSTRNGFAQAYTPSKTKAAEGTLTARVLALLEQEENRAAWPTSGALHLTLVFVLPIPASWPKWKQEAARTGKVKPTGKPDVDNLVKLAKDALNEVLWLDDSQIVSVQASKTYVGTPSTRVGVVEVPTQTERAVGGGA